MAESSWPSPSNLRVIDDPQYEKLALSYAPTAGVVGGFTSPQLVYGDSSGMQIKVAADRYALVRGHEWYSGSTIFTKTIGANASGSTRTDLVVLRLSRTTWDVTVVVVAGTPGAGAPAPTQGLGTTGSFDLPLATVTVTNGAATISAGNVNYIASHLRGDGGGYLLSQFAALAYVPVPLLGQQAILNTTGGSYYYNGTAWTVLHTPMTAFTPVFTSTSGAVNMGTAGILDGRWTQNGKQVHFSGYAWFGNAFSVGTGVWALTLPVAASGASSGSDGQAAGSCYCRDNTAGSSGHFPAICVIQPNLSTTVLNMFSGVAQVGQTNPFLWAAGDSFVWSINYEAA